MNKKRANWARDFKHNCKYLSSDCCPMCGYEECYHLDNDDGSCDKEECPLWKNRNKRAKGEGCGEE